MVSRKLYTGSGLSRGTFGGIDQFPCVNLDCFLAVRRIVQEKEIFSDVAFLPLSRNCFNG